MTWTATIVKLRCLLRGDLVMAFDNKIPIGLKRPVDLTQTLDKVPSKGVVVVNQENHGRL